ncbi:hypothetical protein [Aliterella atlantica]|uniref:Uncharacterized protein n=1 Tax=Aliterella atlantica CENA595 TaxID=1618023 RepID=A0A0D8ZY62_9CYAN|nr:hypothetical protein [Aliterella atlantica]KJH73337.1 hypothetical protein UH38_00670 [Aliterella atlantica CENA595]
MSEIKASIVQYEDRDEETGNYLVKSIDSGEIISVPSVSSIYILKLEKGQILILIQLPEHPQGYLIPPI